jgi:uncharacterized membrane protein
MSETNDEQAKAPTPTTPASDEALPRQRGVATLIMVLGAAGLALAIYLTVQGFTTAAMPGCGPGSGCGSVLASRWSKVLGLPVALPAAMLYLGVIALGYIVHGGRSAGGTRAAWATLVALTGAMAMTAAWFIALQIFDIKSTCPYCMTAHAVAILLAVVVIIASPFALTKCVSHLAVAVMIALAFIGTQMLTATQPPPTQTREPVGHDFDTVVDGQRTIGVLGGKVGLRPVDYPMLGKPDADVVLVLLFDYTCFHCRSMHRYLVDAVEKFQGKLAIVLMPTPLDVDCNPSIDHQEPAHETACDLAELALAVWKLDPKAFAWMDGYLAGGEDTRSIADARQQAEELVDPAKLRQMIDSGWPREQIGRFTTVYGMYGGGQVPALLGQGRITMGVPASGEDLIADLRPLVEPMEVVTTNRAAPVEQ